MSAGRRRGWWFHDVVEPTNEKDEDKDGRFESEGSERRVPSDVICFEEATGLKFERVPASGALEYLKGDLYVPNQRNHFCIEVKNYKDSPLSDRIFTQPKTNNLIRWWKKVVIQAAGGDQKPMLFFKYDRSAVFVVTENTRKYR